MLFINLSYIDYGNMSAIISVEVYIVLHNRFKYRYPIIHGCASI